MLELSQAIIQNKNYGEIKNLWLNKNGNITKNPASPLLNNLDSLPFASFDSKNKIYIDDGRVQNDKLYVIL